MEASEIHLVFYLLAPTIGIMVSIAIPSCLILINSIGEMIGMEQGLLLGETSHGLMLLAIDIMQVSSILGIGEAFVLDKFAIPYRVEIGVLTKPFEFDLVATLVVEMRRVHWAETVGIQVDVEHQCIAIGVVVSDVGLEAIKRSPEVTTLLRIVGERSNHSRIGKATIEVLVVACETGEIDGIALDFVWPSREVNHALCAKDLVDVLAGFGSEIVVGHLRYDAVAFRSPSKEISGEDEREKTNNDTFHIIIGECR